MAENDFYPVPAFAAEATVDFLDSHSLDELEAGVKRLGVVGDLMALVQGIAITKIEREGLWREAGYQNLRAYQIEQAERLGMPRQTVSDRRRMAESWLTFRKQLSKFDLSGHVTKLIYMERALELHPDRREVIQHFKADTAREFKAWAVGAARGPDDQDLPDVELSVRAGEIFLDGEALMSMTDSLPSEEREFLADTLRAAYRARKGGCLAHVVPVYDKGEARAVDNFLKKFRETK